MADNETTYPDRVLLRAFLIALFLALTGLGVFGTCILYGMFGVAWAQGSVPPTIALLGLALAMAGAFAVVVLAITALWRTT